MHDRKKREHQEFGLRSVHSLSPTPLACWSRRFVAAGWPCGHYSFHRPTTRGLHRAGCCKECCKCCVIQNFWKFSVAGGGGGGGLNPDSALFWLSSVSFPRPSCAWLVVSTPLSEYSVLDAVARMTVTALCTPTPNNIERYVTKKL